MKSLQSVLALSQASLGFLASIHFTISLLKLLPKSGSLLLTQKTFTSTGTSAQLV
jgi:hypothetical protein